MSKKTKKHAPSPRKINTSNLKRKKISRFKSKIEPKFDKKTQDCLFGKHPVMAALHNPERRIRKIYALEKYVPEIPEKQRIHLTLSSIQTMEQILQKYYPHTSLSHQGIIALISPLNPTPIASILQNANGTLLMLDQITDPHNLGAIFRSACAFGAKAILTQTRNSAPISGITAKSAAGCIEKIPYIETVNLARSVLQLKQAGYQIIGLSEKAKLPLSECASSCPSVLILGSEEKGIRPNILSKCDLLVRIPIEKTLNSLNVSISAAIALYEFNTRVRVVS